MVPCSREIIALVAIKILIKNYDSLNIFLDLEQILLQKLDQTEDQIEGEKEIWHIDITLYYQNIDSISNATLVDFKNQLLWGTLDGVTSEYKLLESPPERGIEISDFNYYRASK